MAREEEVSKQSVVVVPQCRQHEETLLTKDALQFVGTLHRLFNKTRLQLLHNRDVLLKELQSGASTLDYLPETEYIRKDPIWSGPTVIAPGLANRSVEITGPPLRKMLINALNTPNVNTYMCDFEDSLSPTWENIIQGQCNLYDAIRDNIQFWDSEKNKNYRLEKPISKLPTLIVRPRGWHMVDKHVLVDGEYVSASILDFGLYFYHNAKKLISIGKGPYFYLPKLEHHLEAKLWNDIFNVAQDYINLARGTIRATVLIETIPAAFQMDEIIYQLRTHSSGLNCGRWDYIFSILKKMGHNRANILPDRDQVTMVAPFMSAYVQNLIITCHRRNVHAIGGMAAQIPIKDNKTMNDTAMQKVYNDKLRELNMGHDGSWIAHPALATLVHDIFSQMKSPNQIHYIPPVAQNPTYRVSVDKLLNTEIPSGRITLAGVKQNIVIGLVYMESWLNGKGCVPINHLMEDAATAEVSRLQLNQWVKHAITLDDTRQVLTPDLITKLIKQETDALVNAHHSSPESNKFAKVAQFLLSEILSDCCSPFLTTLLYNELVKDTSTSKHSKL